MVSGSCRRVIAYPSGASGRVSRAECRRWRRRNCR
ncbi:hypothetical protein EBN03_17485 [Nocardia stercoris]|uniref:Uncharacterized protein n=1 Tax=Nocardia stercoris TaxID=2483361 RepID=A0A3M2L0D5_9NOCA|nr:hypothetical protein EBN03_17485 [Nocardia stercoris]